MRGESEVGRVYGGETVSWPDKVGTELGKLMLPIAKGVRGRAHVGRDASLTSDAAATGHPVSTLIASAIRVVGSRAALGTDGQPGGRQKERPRAVNPTMSAGAHTQHRQPKGSRRLPSPACWPCYCRRTAAYILVDGEGGLRASG